MHKLGPTRRGNLFAYVFGKQGLVLIITSETELEISGHVVQRFLSKKSLKKGPRDALRLLSGQDRSRNKWALSLDRFEIASKNNIKLKEKVKVKAHKLKGKVKCIALKIKVVYKSVYIHSV